MIFILSQATQF